MSDTSLSEESIAERTLRLALSFSSKSSGYSSSEDGILAASNSMVFSHGLADFGKYGQTGLTQLFWRQRRTSAPEARSVAALSARAELLPLPSFTFPTSENAAHSSARLKPCADTNPSGFHLLLCFHGLKCHDRIVIPYVSLR